MNRTIHAAVAGLAAVVLTLATQAALAARPISVDQGDSRFPDNGESWSLITPVDYTQGGESPTTTVGFALNFSGSAGAGIDYQVWMPPGGIVFFPDAISPYAGFITPFVAAVRWSGGDIGRGVIDTEGPFDLLDAVEAVRFTWRGVLDSDPTVSVATQVILLNRGHGDFDIQLNYGLFDFAFPPGGGNQLLELGGVTTSLTQANAVFDYCYRDGVSTGCGATTDPIPAPVPEPATLSMLGVGLLLIAGRQVARGRSRPVA